MFNVIFYFLKSVSHNPPSTTRDTNIDKDHEEGGGEDRGTNENPDVHIIDPTVVLDVDI